VLITANNFSLVLFFKEVVEMTHPSKDSSPTQAFSPADADTPQSLTSPPSSGEERFRFDRVELAGAFGDLGTLLPIVVAMIFINKLSSSSVFLAFGLFYLVAGYYYRLPIPVQPLKAVGAISIAYPAVITEPVIGAAGIIFGIFLLALSLTGTIDRIAKLFSQAVVRGIQLTLGLIFLKKGIELIINKELFISGLPGKMADYPVNLLVGVVVFILVLLLLDNKRFPAALVALFVGILSGMFLGGAEQLRLSFGPTEMRLIIPSLDNLWTALIPASAPPIPAPPCSPASRNCTRPSRAGSPSPWASSICPPAFSGRYRCATAPGALPPTTVSEPAPAGHRS
jgi:sulfate permease, SulP family